jgi:glyoxylase-like metal-dependent hydrolase (beta-lactamase superfamily II)
VGARLAAPAGALSRGPVELGLVKPGSRTGRNATPSGCAGEVIEVPRDHPCHRSEAAMSNRPRTLPLLPLLVLSLLTIAAQPLAAQALPPRPSILTYRTVKVAEGVYAFITPEERSGFQSGNSVVIVGDDGVLVFDTGNIPSSTRRQIAEIRRLTPQPVRYVVNSHWHPDHNLGNSEYRAAYPGVRIVGTSATRAGILERVPGYFDQMRSFGTTDSLMRLRLSTGQLRDGTAMPDNLRAVWTVITGDYREFLPEVLAAHPLAPDLVFDDSLTLMLGRRVVKLVRPGRGNTAGDAYLYLPAEQVLLTGDLLTVPCPFPGTAFFGEWIAALDQLKAQGAATIVPGHGEPQHDYAYLDLVRELLVFTRDQARAAVDKGTSLEDAQKAIDFSPFIARFAGGDPIRDAAFHNFYVEPAVQRAYEEAKFASEGPLPKGS